MKQTRRMFLSRILPAVAAFFGLSWVKPPEADAATGTWKPLDTGNVLRVFKMFPDEARFIIWREIPWEAMRKGDQVLVFAASPEVEEGVICQRFVVGSSPSNDPAENGKIRMHDVVDCLDVYNI